MNNFLSFVNETSFLIPIVIILGLSILFTILTGVLKLKFIPAFIIEIILGIILKLVFYDYTFSDTYFNITEIMYTTGFFLLMFLSGFDNNFSIVLSDKE